MPNSHTTVGPRGNGDGSEKGGAGSAPEGSIQTIMLDCGMPLILEAMSGVKSAGVSWLLPAGSATDPDDRLGLCTMWAELLFRGAGDLDSRAQADAMDRLGMSRGIDVSTHHLRMSYTLLGERLAEAMEPIVDVVRRPRMDEDAIDPTRDLALQSLESLADDPHERAVLCLRDRHNSPPLNRSGLGTPAGLTAIQRKDLVGGWQRQARPRGSVLAIAGDAACVGGSAGRALAEQLNRLLTGWEGSQPPVSPRPSTTRGTYHHMQDPSAQVQIVALFDGPKEASPDSAMERVLNGVLSGGMAARLFTEVREKRGLCYAVSQSYAADRDYGRCLAYVGTTPERAQESLDVLMAELERVGTPAGRVDQGEFERAMIGIKSNLVFSGESTAGRAGALAADWQKLGRARSLAEISARYEAVTLDQLNVYLGRRRMGDVTLVTLGPKELTRG